MLIKRRFRFYAAHRNHLLNDKCSRLHGHRYGVEVHIEVRPTAHGVGMLFAEIDEQLSKVFDPLDHRTLAWNRDEVARAIPDAVVLPFPTSAENLAAWLLGKCKVRLDGCVALELQETDSATIRATLEDLSTWPTQSDPPTE